ncbi:MAG: AAA family ATPase [Oscillospiraceae bacterium]|nr:AAA family ATPase [Oscillospiraceae bacterium]
MESKVIEALGSIPVADLSYTEWINVGMALKAEGYDCSVWDDWSKQDSRYHPGECERKWRSFRGDGVKGGTVVQMAMDRGWQYYGADAALDWDAEIEADGDESPAPPAPKVTMPQVWEPGKELIQYLQTLFKPDDKVAYVTNDVWQDEDGKWVPSKGNFDRTAEQLIAGIRKHPNDLGAVLGDYKPDAGAWIRFNPVDGTGVKNDNVTRFQYALVESDTLSVDEQYAAYLKMELPIACLVHSGGKSLHAIVHVDAHDLTEYRQRVEYLYGFLNKHGVQVDTQNKNPSRLSRMPGVTRNGNRQYLVATNIGRKSWADWLDYAEGVSDDLPDIVNLADYKDNPPTLPEELVCGILRCGHKMLISGSSKAGKSFLLMELCIAISEGAKWLGFQCRKGRVLYVNLEIDPSSCIMRFMKIYEAMGMDPKHMDDIEIWNLRGHAVPLNELVPKLIRKVSGRNFDAVVIDPIYKVITGDENNASEMGAFCNQFDKICTETGCAAIYCHHHSKGAQGAKKAMDRASGSGVFARDPDAQLDMIQLELTDDLKNNVRDGNATAWRLESSLREFENIQPVNFWFEYPLHKLDTTGDLAKCGAEGSPQANLQKSSKYTTADERKDSILNAYDACMIDPPVTVTAMAEYIGITERCVRDRLKEMKDVFWCKGGVVGRIDDKRKNG